jgi:dipeptidyl-peptidase-4
MHRRKPLLPRPFLLLALLMVPAAVALAQDRLPGMPRYDRYDRVSKQLLDSVKRADVASVAWERDGHSFQYTWDRRRYRFDIDTQQATDVGPAPAAGPFGGGRRPGSRGGVQGSLPGQPPAAGQSSVSGQAPPGGRPFPARGRQSEAALSPNGAWKAFYRDRNVYLARPDGSAEEAVTTEGSAAARSRFGSASWVYGEELGVREAMWWSPDSARLAFYGFDESKVQDYFLVTNQTGIQDSLDVEAYPKPGTPNPTVDLWVYRPDTRTRVPVETRFGDPSLGHYVYDVRWSPDGRELLFNRTDRKQKTMEMVAADPDTGRCRVVFREIEPASWTENSPPLRWLEKRPGQPQRFLVLLERNGFRNIYLGDLSGTTPRPVTAHPFEVAQIERVDERAGLLYYTAHDGDNPYKLQLHRIGLDCQGEQRLTDPAFHHTVSLSPDGRYFLDQAETLDAPPVVTLCEAQGKPLKEIMRNDLAKFEQLGLKRTERFVCKAADGVTDLYGTLLKPSDFDRAKKYPVLVNVYAGPESSSFSERFRMPDAASELGFLVFSLSGRGTVGRGQAFSRAVYGKLGIVEIDDQAAGIRTLAQRPYVDAGRVGITGTSYGGYAAIMCLLRYPQLFHVAVASSSVTDWRNYDSIYTERYMGLPDEKENKAGYDAGAAVTYVSNLKGRLMLSYGTADNNVHPANTLQLVRALQRAGRSFDLMVTPDGGHGPLDRARTWEYFMDHLVLAKQ